GAHFIPVTGSLSWPDSDLTPRTFQVPIIDDFTTNTDRTVNLRLTGPTGGATLGSISNAMLRISDNDNPAGAVDFNYRTGTGANDSVNAIQLTTNGQSLVAGDFKSFNGIDRTNVARLLVDGNMDTDFTPNFGVTVTNTAFVASRSLANDTTVTITTVDPHLLTPNTNVIISGINRPLFNTSTVVVATNSPTSFTYTISPVQGVVQSVTVVSNPPTGNLGAIYTLSAPHQLLVGDSVTITGLTNLVPPIPTGQNFSPSPLTLNGVHVVTTIPSPNQIRVILGLSSGEGLLPPTPDSGTVRLTSIPNGPSSGTVTHTYQRPKFLPASVRSIAVYTNGMNLNKVVMAGDFKPVDNQPSLNIARLNENGTIDVNFLDGLIGANNIVNAVAIQSEASTNALGRVTITNRVLLGGRFTAVNGTPRNFIARLTDDGSLDTTFDPGPIGPSAQVRALVALPGGRTVIAGDFDSVSGVPNRRIARLNNDG
ncbi:MAG: hypothetical protein FJ336_06310, partial [Sphingomonadales bacterium]|nr:hypothetical protein [Sphingomonadales bacterium]